MKRILLIILCAATLSSLEVRGQHESIALTIGYPLNFTGHWAIEKWNPLFHAMIRYTHSFNGLALGAGMGYSQYSLLWSDDFYHEKNSFSDLNIFFLIGKAEGDGFISLLPNIRTGSTLFFQI